MKLGTSRHAVVLGLFCLGFGIVLALTNQVTTDDITQRATEDRLNSLAQVLPAELYDASPLDNVLTVADAEGKEVKVYRAQKNGRITGVAYEIRGSGYAGEIRLMMGVDADGRILGVRVLAHKETPGLGDKIELKKGDWILRFTGLSVNEPSATQWKVKKDGGQFDQFAGATITPRGVVAAVHRGLELFQANQTMLKEVK
jgi:Na+-translocating ferredoxin:NAD+ oxidoreductase subunit G